MDQSATPTATLYQERQRAAQLSDGISNEVIYFSFESALIAQVATGNLLDWGAGKGLLTKRLFHLNRFNSITAVDIQSCPLSCDPSIQWIQADLNQPLELEHESFDVIVSAEVIEHLENPRAIAREWLRLLKPGGLLIFSTPNNESWRALLALLLRGHFVEFGDSSYPAHITALLRKDISRILTEAGFDLPQFLFTNAGKIPRFPQYSWQRLPCTAFKGLRFSDNILAITHKQESMD